MIRVLHVIDHLDLGGAQTALLDMLGCRDRDAFAVEVAVMHGRGSFAATLEKMGIPVWELSATKWPPAYLAGFLARLASGRYDVLHFHLQGANWIAKPLAALTGHPVRISHDHASGDIRFRGMASLVPDALAHRFSSRVVAVSGGVRDFLRQWEAVPDDVVEVISNGVNTANFSPGTLEQKLAWRKKQGIPSDAFVVGAMGRLAPEKNFIMVPELARRHPGVYFVLAGEGPEASAVKARAKDLGVDDRVRLLGSVGDRPAFYQALDVFLLPSLYEGLPMVLLEAMAARVPVLASRLEGIAAAMPEEEDGLLACPDDIEDFSRQLRRLIESPALRETLAAGAIRKVRDSFSASETSRRVEAIYRQELAKMLSTGK
jgi:glycosyltransferase involved in cell wall biosynthesis